MKILFPCGDILGINLPLAKEVGLYEAAMIVDLHKEIMIRGTKKNGIMMVARDEKQLRELFPYCKNITLIRKVLDRLQGQGFIYITQDIIYNDGSFWFGFNEEKLRGLKSIIIMSDEEYHDVKLEQIKLNIKPHNGNGNNNKHSIRYKILYGTILRACHWDGSLGLSQKDRTEAGESVKFVIGRYPNHDIQNLKLMILGIDIYRSEILKQKVPYRPSGINRAWGSYSDWCNEFNNGEPPIDSEESYNEKRNGSRN